MAFAIIHGRREITRGPGAKNWALAMIDLGRPVELTVRGLRSACKCSEFPESYLVKCQECKEGERVHLRVIGTFAPDMKQEAFIFWGVIAEQRKHLVDNEGPRTDGDHDIPPNTQLVYGLYIMSSGRKWISWMAPAGHSFGELCAMLRNTSDLRHTFLTNEDNKAMKQAIQEGRLILLPPDRLWGMIRKRRSITIPLKCVETGKIDRGQICVVGAKIIAQEGSMDEFDPKDSSEWTRFFLCLEISKDSGRGTDFDVNLTFINAWMDIHNDGHWNYIWAKLPDGQTISWIQAGLK